MSQTTSRLEDLKTLRNANLDLAFAMAFMTLTTGPFIVGFIRFLGGNDVWVGVMTAIPSLLGLLQIPGAIVGRSFPKYKGFIFHGGLAWRVLHVPLIVLPLLALSNDVRLISLALCVGAAWAAVQFVNPCYNDWLAEMIPANSRGWFFSRRSAISAAVGASIGLVGGLVLDALKNGGNEAAGYSTVFGLAVLCGLLSFYFFLKMTDRDRLNPVKVTLRAGLQAIGRPYADRRFRQVLTFSVAFIVGQSFAGNFFAAYALESLAMPFSVLQVALLMHAAGNVAFARMWGYLADKYGNKPILAILVVGLFLTPVMWLFCYPGHDPWNAIILIPGHLFSGAVWGGIAVCQFNLLLATAKPEERANYIAAGLALQAVVGAVAPFLGSIVMQSLRLYFPPDVAYRLVFGITMVFRLASLMFLLPVREEGSHSVGGTLSQLRRVSPKGYLALRQLSKSTDVATRESAIQSVGSQQMGIAAEEVIKTLHDPSPRLRRQAALTLAELGDPKAIGALLHQLEEHPDLVEVETISALGRLGGSEATEALVRYLKSPRPQLRRASAQALGRIGGEAAERALLDAASEAGDPDLRRASLQALRNLESRQAETVVADALFDPHPSVRIAAAEAVAEMGFSGAAPNLRQSLEWYDDEASSESAYALGCVGAPEDVPLILGVAAKCTSIITRRRCLLGVARLLGVEAETYRLMLLEGMSRDSALLEAMRPLTRRNAGLAKALERFSTGDEAEALRLLIDASRDPLLKAMAEPPVSEAFLVAACRVAKRGE